MATESNIITSDKLGLLVKSIDLVERFQFSIEELLEIMGITRRIGLTQDAIIKTYKWVVTMPPEQVGEGITIPATLVERKPGPEYRVPFNKHRKIVTAEAIHRHGIDRSLNESDEKLLQEIQGNVVGKFYEFLAAAPTKQIATTLQSSLSTGWARAKTFFPGHPEVISFVNAMDVAKWLGEKQINATASTAYGFTLLNDFLNQKVFIFDGVPEGKVYTTAAENIVLASQDVRGNDLAKAFNLSTDQSGLIGVTHSAPLTSNATIETLAFEGSTLFAETLDGVVETSITSAPPAP